jgi:hypothetical protein
MIGILGFGIKIATDYTDIIMLLMKSHKLHRLHRYNMLLMKSHRLLRYNNVVDEKPQITQIAQI